VHVARFGDEVHEVLVQTWVAAGERVVDGSTWPPRVLEGEGLAEVLRSSPESLSPGAALQVLPLIIEAAVEGPVLGEEIPEEVPDDVRREFEEICQEEFGRNTGSDGDGGHQ